MTGSGIISSLAFVLLLGMAVSAGAADNARPFPDRREGVFIARDFKFQTGEVLPELKLGYTTLGMPRRDASGAITNAVLLLHGTTGTGGNWLAPSLAEALFREGQTLDAGKYYLILADSIGLGRSSKPSDGLKIAFPRYGYRDMVEAQYRLVTEGLGVKHLRLVLGTSMGRRVGRGEDNRISIGRFPASTKTRSGNQDAPTNTKARSNQLNRVRVCRACVGFGNATLPVELRAAVGRERVLARPSWRAPPAQ